MYVVDDICYAGVPGGEIRIVAAEPLVGGMLLVSFLSGEKKLVDMTEVKGKAFEPLRDESVFRTLKVEHGFVSWLDGEIDIAPEYLYEHGIAYNECDDLLAVA